MAGGGDDVTVDRRERGGHRSSSIGEANDMNASTPTAGTSRRPSAAYRQLVMRGLTPSEAGNVTAMMRGIPIGATPWTLREINHLLFLRAMRDAGRFGVDDGAGRVA
jgi:hypothetical protein